MKIHQQNSGTRWALVLYDVLLYLLVDLGLMVLYQIYDPIGSRGALIMTLVAGVLMLAGRFVGKIYRQIWRYGGIQCYLRMIVTDFCSFAVFVLVNLLDAHVLAPNAHPHVSLARMLAMFSTNLLLALTIRMVYRYAYKCGNEDTRLGRLLRLLLRVFARMPMEDWNKANKTAVAIIGAGRMGVALAEDLNNNFNGEYQVRCFVDTNAEKIGRAIHNLPVLPEDASVYEHLRANDVTQVVLALPNVDTARKQALYEAYTKAGFKMKVYDDPGIRSIGTKPKLREFDIEDLLFRSAVTLTGEKARAYYRDKSVLITGGGGSIGSELCRQLVKYGPRQLVILDVYENGAYDVKQELSMLYGRAVDLQVEIATVTNYASMDRIFARYKPDVVIHAAAHKHVPLMEHNCIEAIENNVFGTKNVIDLCERYGVSRFLMVSTDKAVNPTNVMGATKRLCEMMVQAASTAGRVQYSATRFGNVLGSAGSVVPLFRRQIAAGGPVTITDKRIIRYFMTIPEAAQLVLESGAMANNGELYVLDMGEPVKIYDLAKSMIRLSGVGYCEIKEIGLRPGEKLYEELLVRPDELGKTANSKIFVERDVPLPIEVMVEKLQALKEACASGDEALAKATLKAAVPTFVEPDIANNKVE